MLVVIGWYLPPAFRAVHHRTQLSDPCRFSFYVLPFRLLVPFSEPVRPAVDIFLDQLYMRSQFVSELISYHPHSPNQFNLYLLSLFLAFWDPANAYLPPLHV